MAGTRTKISRLIAASLVATVATGIAGAASVGADELAPSSPEQYRATTGADSFAASTGYDGRGVTVAVIDTGVANVPALDGTVIHQENISAAPADGDQYGHGTFVAGLVHEVAPGAKIVSIKLSGASGAVDVTQVLAALQWVAINRERFSIDVVNLSFGNDSKQSAYTSPLNFAVQQLWKRGIVVVASAGNLGDGSGTVTKPGDDPFVISVGASDERGTSDRGNDFVPAFVSRGPTQDGLAKPDLVAPGTRLISLRAPGSTVDQAAPHARVGDHHFRGSGTSFAAPVVSGLVAQLLSADPSLSPNQVKYGLMKGAELIQGDPAAMGAGTVRVHKALSHARSGSANANATHSSGTGSLDGARGSAVVDVSTYARDDQGLVQPTKVRLRGSNTAESVPQPELADGSLSSLTLDDAVDGFDQAQYLDPSGWDASSWGASSWGASQWGASQWGASSWGASSWGASSWGSSQWWASSWG